MNQVVVEGTVHGISVEDNGMAKTAEPDDGVEGGLFVRIQSWEDHADFDALVKVGGRYRITIERLDP